MLMLGIYDGPAGGLLLDCTPYLIEQLALGNDKHGYESLSSTVERRLVAAFKLYARTAIAWAKLWWEGQIVWEGRVEDPSVWAKQGSGLRFVAFGAWRALSDIPYTALWSTTDYGAWKPVTQAEVAGRTPDKYNMDMNGRLYVSLKKGQSYANGADIGSFILKVPYGGRKIVGFSCDYTVNLPNIGGGNTWLFGYATWDEGFLSPVATTITATAGVVFSRTVHYVVTACDYLELFIYNNTGGVSTPAGEDGANYLQIRNLRVVTTTANRVNTTLGTAVPSAGSFTVTPASMARIYVGQQLQIDQGTNVSETITVSAITSTTFTATYAIAAGHLTTATVNAHVVYADEILKDMVAVVSAANPNQLSASTAFIQSPSLDLLHESYDDQAMGSVIDRLGGLGDNQTPARVWEACVLSGQQLVFRPRGSAARAWFTDVSSLQAERSMESYANSVYATYQDAGNRTLRTAVSANAIAVSASGLTRRASVQASTSSATQAGVQRDAYLDDHDDLSARSTIAFERLFDSGGANHKLWDARAGDTLTIRNLPPASGSAVDSVRTITIGRASLDVTSRVLTIEPDPPPPQLASLLARLSAGLKPT